MSKTQIVTGGIADDAVSEEHLDATAITGSTELAATPADTDEILISDAGTLKRIDFSHIKNPMRLNLTCYTGDSFATDLTPYDDVVDMEAYALAKTCRNLGKDFVSYKYISDDGNADDWEKNCSKGVEEFKKVLEYYDNL